MKIINKSTKKIIATDVRIASSLRDQTFGMIRYKKPQALRIKTRFGIHTFFMKYPIDLLILDNTNTVVAMKEQLKPNAFFLWNIRYNTVLELEKGTITRTKTAIGDRLEYID